MWKDVEGWEGLYEVSDNAEVRNKQNGKLRVFDTNSAGYKRVTLYRKGHDPEKERFLVHRLVAKHFVPNPHNLPEVNHKIPDASKNESSNLEWTDRKGNEIHSRKYGQKEYKPFYVDFSDGSREIYDCKTHLAEELGISRSTIKTWLNNGNHGYIDYGINSISYLKDAIYYN